MADLLPRLGSVDPAYNKIAEALPKAADEELERPVDGRRGRIWIDRAAAL